MAEFHADTLSFVGNFAGSCIIYLNGEAITVKQSNGMEVAKWPYNCIRQFRAEEESGKFSFVSGRRGPYGVAEYNFSLSDRTLLELQSALTQFTGAQFNQVPQGSGSIGGGGGTQQQSRLRQPSTSSTSSYGTGSRMSIDASPIHRVQYAQAGKPPATPPRDYLQFGARNSFGSQSDVFTASTNNSTPSPLITSEENAFGGYAKGRSRMNKSTSEILSLSGGSATPPPRLPKRSDPTVPTSVATSSTTPPSQESWVLKSQSYEQTRIQQTGGDSDVPKPMIYPKPGTTSVLSGGVVNGKKPPPPIPPKRSPLTEISSTAEQQENKSPSLGRSSTPSKHTSSTSSLDRHNLTRNLRKQQTEPIIHHQPSTTATPTRLPMTPPIREHIYEEADKQRANTTSSTYDVVPSKPRPSGNSQSSPTDQDMLNEPEHGRKRSKSFSPEPTLPKVKEEIGRQSASQEDDPTSSNLDILPRSSPQVRIRSITPEQAQSLRRDEGKGSPLMAKRSKTIHTFSNEVLPSSDTYDVPKPLRHSPDEGVYNVPKPLSAPYDPEGTYHIPRPSEDVYHVPRSQDDIHNRIDHYHHPRPADSVYKVPVPASSVGMMNENMYSVPQKVPKTQPNSEEVYYSYPPEPTDFTDGGNGVYQVPKSNAEADNVYKVPRSVLEEAADSSETDNVYKVPKSVLLHVEQNTDDDNVYNVPRSLSANEAYTNGVRRHNSSSPPPSTNTYETIDTSPRSTRRVLGKLRAARSFESLLGNRINTTTPIELTGPQLPTNPNLYVAGMDVNQTRSQMQQQQQAANRGRAGLVTRPENVYAEIPEDVAQEIRRVPSAVTNGGRTHSSRGRSHYDTLPLRGTALEIEGLAKAQELHEEGGYELVLPPGVREEQLRAMTLPHRSKQHRTTPPRQLPPSATLQPRLKHVQDKYGIDRGTARRHSEGLVLDSSSLDYPLNPSESILGSSIPTDSTLETLDEYVIITRTDTRPKIFNSTPQPILTSANRVVIPQGSIPSVGSDSSMSSGDKLEDSGDYELMSSARINMVRAKYNTPNPTLATSSQAQGNVGQSRGGKAQERSSGGDVLEHFYGNTFQTVGSFDSMNSQRDSVFSDKSSDVELGGSSPTHTTAGGIQSPGSKKKIQIALGSPNDTRLSLNLRNRSCSVDNVLEGTTSAQTVEKSPQVKKHNYVNVSPEDEQRARAATAAQLSSSNQPIDKRPMPLPRNASTTLTTVIRPDVESGLNIRPEETGLPASRRTHSYERVDPMKVKGNNNPLSSNEPDTPQ